MKRIFITCLIAIVALSACTSKEEKANKLIRDEMFKTLYDFDSYQPVETKIDSAFNSPVLNDTLIAMASLAQECLDNSKEALDEAKRYLRSVSIWSDSYSSYGRSEYYEAKENMNESMEKAKSEGQKSFAYMLLIKEKAQNCTNEFIGWKVTHKYRCKTKGGYSALGTEVYIFDKKMKSIITHYDLEDEDRIKAEALIEEAIGYTEEKIQDYRKTFGLD